MRHFPKVGSIPERKLIVRKDGLKVFLDGDTELDQIRLHEPDPRKVILAVAIRRAQQIARHYVLQHAPELFQEIEKLTGWNWKDKLKQLRVKKLKKEIEWNKLKK